MKELWQPVIGLEIHAQLNTQSKIFSSAPNRFGDEPNTNISTVCTGQPGALPVLNKEAVKKAVQFGLGIEGTISEVSTFDRKSYFYPDSPRNFQITQFYHPIIHGGKVIAEIDGKEQEFYIDHVHLEDDSGSLKHFTSFGGVDYNRAGSPLIEIVSKPCMHSPKEAAAYATAVKSILEYLDISDCNMDEGSIRFDANVSVRKLGETSLRPKTEIKNLNSFNFLQLALEAEIERQINLYTKHPEKEPKELIKQGTYRWDGAHKKIFLMRVKEHAEDYRYCPEPDLPPLILTKKYIKALEKNLPELPREQYKRYIANFHLSPYASQLLTNDKKLASYFEKGAALSTSPQSLCNLITVEFAGQLKDTGTTVFSLGIPPEHIAKLSNLIENKTITGKIAKLIVEDMIKNPQKDPEAIFKENPNYQPLSNESEIEAIIDKILAQNAQSIIDYKAGKKRAFGFLVGQVMQATQGKADPAIVNDLLNKKIENSN